MPEPVTPGLQEMLQWVQTHEAELDEARKDFVPTNGPDDEAASAFYALWRVQQRQMSQALEQIAELQRQLLTTTALRPATLATPLLCAEELDALRQIHLSVDELSDETPAAKPICRDEDALLTQTPAH